MMHSVPNDSTYEPLNEKDEPVFLNPLCPVAGCTFPDTHHHLEECAGEATGCDGTADEYDQTKICCQLGDLYDPAWSVPTMPSMTPEEARELLKRPANNTLRLRSHGKGIY